MGKRVGVILSGCGVYDGAEIHESVLTLLALDRAGAEIVCMAPDMTQHHVVNHMTGGEQDHKRNVLVEASRIARGNIKDIADVHMKDLDALVVPGGFGAAKNLCTFAFKGVDCDINVDVVRLLKEAIEVGKPIGAMCIAPAVVARAFAGSAVKMTLTIGNDKGTAQALEKLGAVHKDCPEGEIVVDLPHKLVTTPAYMYDSRISMVAKGIDALINKVIALA